MAILCLQEPNFQVRDLVNGGKETREPDSPKAIKNTNQNKRTHVATGSAMLSLISGFVFLQSTFTITDQSKMLTF